MIKKGIADTLIVTLIMFIGTGVYNMYKIHKDVKRFEKRDIQIQEIEDKYCKIQNPTPEQQAICVDILKIKGA